MDERERTGPVSMEESDEPGSEAAADAKARFFETLDAKRAGVGHAVGPRSPAPPAPAQAPPALSFEAWMDVSVRFAGAPLEDLVAALSTQGVSREAWTGLDRDYRRALSNELLAGKWERWALYEAKHKEALARRGGAPAVPAEARSPVLRAEEPMPAFDPLRSTAGLPDMPNAIMEVIGRMPFGPSADVAQEAAAPGSPGAGKRPAKTLQSKAVPSGGLTMSLDGVALQTPTLPFAGSTGSVGVLPVPELTAMQVVSLRVELMLQPAPREETLRRYGVPTEGVYRALEERWRGAERRGEIEWALVTLGVVLRRELLG